LQEYRSCRSSEASARYVFSVMFHSPSSSVCWRRGKRRRGRLEEESAGNFVIVVVAVFGSLMGEETKDEQIETMALNAYLPWAKLSCPFGADPSGRMAGAKHIQALEREEGRA
jgi:hypothetical protein